MLITMDAVAAAVPPPRTMLVACWPHLEDWCEWFDIAGSRVIEAAFLATLAHESDKFRTATEYASGAGYDGRADLGNTKAEAIAAAIAVDSTPGRFYRGHGLIQITGYSNHEWMSEELGEDFVGHPERLALPEFAARSACIFWRGGIIRSGASHDLNPYAEVGNFMATQNGVNRGNPKSKREPLGWADRLHYYNALLGM